MYLKSMFVITGLLLPVSFLYAAETPATTDNKKPAAVTQARQSEVPGKWQGGAELGFVTTSGNTDTQSTNAKITIEYLKQQWKHQFKADAFRSEENGVTTADHYSFLFRSQYNIREKEFMFGSARYEKDVFSGFNSRTTEVIGYGYEVIRTDDFNMNLDAGVGARQTRFVDNTKTNEAILRLATALEWKISPTSEFRQGLSVEHGDKNTYTESVTQLKVKINSSLAMKLTTTIKDNSEVPAGKKHTDSETAVTLVYDF